MSGKKAQQTPPENDEKKVDSSELATLRQIVFGAAQQQIEHKLAALEQTMLARFAQTNELLAQQIQQLSETMQSGFDDVHQRVVAVDKCYDEKTAELQGATEKLSSELEMSDSNNKQDTDELHNLLEKAVQDLTAKYDAKFNEALEKLDQVTTELSSTKTDRKTLAKLLAAMAVNLETDQQ